MSRRLLTGFCKSGFWYERFFFKSQRIHLIEQLNPLVHEDRFIHSISDEAKLKMIING